MTGNNLINLTTTTQAIPVEGVGQVNPIGESQKGNPEAQFQAALKGDTSEGEKTIPKS